MYGRKRKYPSSSVRGQGAAKRRYQRGRAHLRPARPFFASSRPRYLSYRGPASTAIIRQPSSLPDRLHVKLVYREQLNWTTASGALGDNVYRGNSLFDPDVTGSGGQPMGLDQWTNFYGYYTVVGSAIEVTSMINSGTCATQRHGVTATTTSTAFASSDQERAEELPYTRAVSPQVGSANAASGVSVVKSYMSTAKINGIQASEVLDSPDWSALMTANPTKQWYWHVWNYVPGGETQSLYQTVRLVFYCVLKTRLQLSIS